MIVILCRFMARTQCEGASVRWQCDCSRRRTWLLGALASKQTSRLVPNARRRVIRAHGETLRLRYLWRCASLFLAVIPRTSCATIATHSCLWRYMVVSLLPIADGVVAGVPCEASFATATRMWTGSLRMGATLVSAFASSYLRQVSWPSLQGTVRMTAAYVQGLRSARTSGQTVIEDNGTKKKQRQSDYSVHGRPRPNVSVSRRNPGDKGARATLHLDPRPPRSSTTISITLLTPHLAHRA
jgi:hypothetical protein